MSDSVALRCSICALNWPIDQRYKTCPQCEEKTSRCRNVTPMDENDAASLAAHLEFDRYYEKWDASHAPERLLPDVNGEAV